MSFSETLRVKPNATVDLGRFDPDAAPGVEGKEQARKELEEIRERLEELQYRLYAEGKRALLVVLQAMDAGGKDGVIRHVISGFNPSG